MIRMFGAIRRILGVSAIFLVFAACDGLVPAYYAMKGTPSGNEIAIRGRVYAEGEEDEDGNPVKIPIKGIVVYVENITDHYAHLTNTQGGFSLLVPKREEYTLIFSDIDGDANGGQFRQYILDPAYSLKEIEEPLEITLEKE